MLGVMDSLLFDWQARRYVETHLNFYILNLLCFPRDTDVNVGAVASRAARLSCIDERFADFAKECGVACGRLPEEERATLRAEIDAFVARGYGLEAADLEVIFEDFTLKAVSKDYRELVRQKFAEVAS